MNKKLRERLDSWDVKSLMISIVLVAAGVFLFYYLEDIRERFREFGIEKYEGQALGEVLSIEPIMKTTQSRTRGTQSRVDRYRVVYRFSVSTQEFQRTDVIPLSKATAQFLKRVLMRMATDTFIIKYDLKDPGKSILLAE